MFPIYSKVMRESSFEEISWKLEEGRRREEGGGMRERVVALTVVVQGILEVVEVQELVSSFADEV